jgi:hypothetical protein
MSPLLTTTLKYIKIHIEYIIFFGLLLLLVFLILNREWEFFMNQMQGINQLDAIIYINLESRADRKELLLKELEKCNVDMSKVHKVSGVAIPKNGHKGCVQSHILALNMIKLNGWKRVLILEDDAELNLNPDYFNAILAESLQKLDEQKSGWNVLMLASANKVLYNTEHKNAPEDDILLEPISTTVTNTNTTTPKANASKHDLIPNKICRLYTATTSSAYIINADYVDAILALFNTCNKNMEHHKMHQHGFEIWALDQKWAELQKKDKWYCFDNDLIKQRNIWSSIQSGI